MKHNENAEKVVCSLCNMTFTLSHHLKTIHKKREASQTQTVQFSESEVLHMVKAGNLTDRQILAILERMRKEFGRNIITPKIKEKLRNRKRILDQYINNEGIEFINKDGDKFKTSFVYCEDITGLVNFICDLRSIEKKDCEMVVGIDNGKGKLIMTLNCVNKNEETKQSFMSTGAKKGFVIGCAENYSNVAMFFEKTQVEKLL